MGGPVEPNACDAAVSIHHHEVRAWTNIPALAHDEDDAAVALRLGLRLESLGGEGQREKRHREDEPTAHTQTVQRGAPDEAVRREERVALPASDAADAHVPYGPVSRPHSCPDAPRGSRRSARTRLRCARKIVLTVRLCRSGALL